MEIQEKIQKIINTLDHYLGDTDPDFPEDMTDDEIRQEEPVFWATKELSKLIGNLNKESEDLNKENKENLITDDLIYIINRIDSMSTFIRFSNGIEYKTKFELLSKNKNIKNDIKQVKRRLDKNVI